MKMQMSGVASSRPDLSTLSLDAALQLDLLERDKAANTQVLVDFLACLGALDGSPSPGKALSLSARPQNVEIFNSVLHRVEAEPAKDIHELEERVAGFFRSMQNISEGRPGGSLSDLKAFCLSLHQALLNEYSPFKSEDDWILMSNERFA